MIQVLQRGSYRLVETKEQTKILILDDIRTYAWVNAKDIGEILVVSHKTHVTDTVLSTGFYRIYDVKDEPRLVDQIHLELSVGKGNWQGYLLPTGLPTDKDIRHRVIPTNEIITKAQS